VPLQRRIEAPRREPGRRGGAPPSGAESARRRQRRRWSWKRRIGVGVLVLLVVLAVWAVAGYFAVRSGVADANKRLPAGAESALTKQNGLLLSNTTDILLLGTDHSSHASRAGDHHSDSITLLRTDPSKHRLIFLRIPRDLRVPIPGHGDDKINAAFQIGGPQLAIKTIESFTGLPVNHVVVVDFGEFEKLIDAVGGVDINVPGPILSDKFDCPYSASRCQSWQGWRFRKGLQHMNAHRALIYSRVRVNRLNPSESDITRGERQQQVIQAVLGKLVSVGTFFRLPFSGGDFLKPLATDLSANDFVQLAWVKFRAGSVLRCRLGGTDQGSGYITGSEDNVAVIAMVKGDSAPQPPKPGSGPYGAGCVRGNQGFK
jgi:LCP family protein required for cell wall assembly